MPRVSLRILENPWSILEPELKEFFAGVPFVEVPLLGPPTPATSQASITGEYGMPVAFPPGITIWRSEDEETFGALASLQLPMSGEYLVSHLDFLGGLISFIDEVQPQYYTVAAPSGEWQVGTGKLLDVVNALLQHLDALLGEYHAQKASKEAAKRALEADPNTVRAKRLTDALDAELFTRLDGAGLASCKGASGRYTCTFLRRRGMEFKVETVDATQLVKQIAAKLSSQGDDVSLDAVSRGLAALAATGEPGRTLQDPHIGEARVGGLTSMSQRPALGTPNQWFLGYEIAGSHELADQMVHTETITAPRLVAMFR